MKTGIKMIAKERKEQINKHGFTTELDVVYHSKGELVQLALHAIGLADYPDEWDKELKNKIRDKNPIDSLVVAGALIAAEIDRLLALKQQ